MAPPDTSTIDPATPAGVPVDADPARPDGDAHPAPLSIHLAATDLEDWLGRTRSLSPAAARAVAAAVVPGADTREGTLVAGPSPIAGLGLFTTAPIEENAVITICPLLRLPERLMDDFADTEVYGHCFDLGEGVYGYPMGLATLLNHDARPSARCELDADEAELWVYATCDIAAGDEITIDYTGGDPDHELWFDPDA